MPIAGYGQECPSSSRSRSNKLSYGYIPPRHNPWAIALTVTMATFMEVLDTSIANVALPHIGGSLSATQEEATWVLTSYLVSNAVVLPISAWVATMIGRKRFYMLCVALFTASSFFCGLAPTLPILIFCRVLQGFGGGGLAPSEQSILADTFPPERRGMAFALYGMAVVVAPAIGPTLGGWITDNFAWRWIFFINVPIGILSLLLTNHLVDDPPYLKEERKKLASIDYMGLGLITLGIGCLQVVLDKGQQADWFASTYITAFTVVAITCLLIFVFWEWQQKNPIVDVRLFKQRNFATAASFMFLLGMVLFGTTVLIPQFLQTQLGYTAELAGKALSPGGLVMMAMMPLSGFLVSRVDPRAMMAGGFLVTSMSLFHMSGLYLGIDFQTAMLYRVYQVLGLAFVFVPNNTLAYVGIPREKNNQISGMINLMRNVGGSIGISMLTTFLARRSQVHVSELSEHTAASNPIFRNFIEGLTHTFVNAGMSASQAAHRAYLTAQHIVFQQAAVKSYSEVIQVAAVILLCLSPLPFLMKRPVRGQQNEAPVH